jgi:hypothetical protein
MSSASRAFAFLVLTVLALGATGCGGNGSKIVGKWKMAGAGNDQLKIEGIVPYMEFKADGTGTQGLEVTDAKAKEFLGDGFSMGFKYKVSGDTIEVTTDQPKDGKDGKKEVSFGKSSSGKGTLKFDDSDTLTITYEEAKDRPVKLTRIKK